MIANNMIANHVTCCMYCKANCCQCKKMSVQKTIKNEQRMSSKKEKLYKLNRAIARAEKHMDMLLHKIIAWEEEKKKLQNY